MVGKVEAVLIELDLNQLLEGGGPHTQIPQFNVVSREKWIHLDNKKVFVHFYLVWLQPEITNSLQLIANERI